VNWASFLLGVLKMPFALAYVKKNSYFCRRNVNFLKFEAIEELTLYILQQEERIKQQELRINALENNK
jgi:hypothetical protein